MMVLFKIAIETQTNIKPLLFIDTIDRLHYNSIFSLTPGKNRVVYLNEIDVSGFQLTDVELLKQKAYNLMEERLKHYRSYKSE
jgi:1-acyl-sn-glycerol-3-phosphate acyltransferase